MEDKRFEQLRRRLSANVKRRRKELGFSQEGLALEAGVDRTYVSQIERGIGNPSLLILTRLAAILKVRVVELLQ
jgi:transcriptional regulator with XRE-family HTH domain